MKTNYIQIVIYEVWLHLLFYSFLALKKSDLTYQKESRSLCVLTKDNYERLIMYFF